MNIALILSGGIGSRLGADRPKQYIEVGDKPIIAYVLETYEQCDEIDKIQIVAGDEWREYIGKWVGEKLAGYSTPGLNRQLSILAGLEDIRNYASDDDIVIIHDAVRPLVSEELINKCINALNLYDGVMPIISMKDTVYNVKDGRVISLVNREEIVRGQAPEGFRLEKYYQANKALIPDKIMRINGSSEPAIMAGMNVGCIQGNEANYKITTQDDLDRFTQSVLNRN